MNSNWRGWLGGVLLVLAGAALGLATEHIIILHRHQAATYGAPSHRDLLGRLDKELQLTSAQHDAINSILKRHQAQIDSVWVLMDSRLRSSMDSVHQEIGRVLTPAQVERFHAWVRNQYHHHL